MRSNPTYSNGVSKSVADQKIDFSRGCEGPERGPVIQVDEYPAPSLFSAISGMGLEKSAE